MTGRENLGEGVLLFGGSGFMGPYLLDRNPAMISVGRTRPPTPNRHIAVESLDDLSALGDVDFDRVIYIIGNTDHHAMERDRIPADEPTAFDYHLIPFVRVMEQIKHREIRKFIHFSTVLIYDENKITLPVDEHGPIDPYKNRYALSKYLAEEACRFYARWVPIINVRMSNLYGPTPLRRFDLIHVLCRKLLADGNAEIWTDKPYRDFIYVADAVSAIEKLLDSEYTGTLNLGTGTMTSIRHVVDLLQELSGCPITVLDKPVTGPLRFQCDMRTLDRLIDWRPCVAIDDGIERTFRQTQAWMESGELVTK